MFHIRYYYTVLAKLLKMQWDLFLLLLFEKKKKKAHEPGQLRNWPEVVAKQL
jgi:hypothetical protein